MNERIKAEGITVGQLIEELKKLDPTQLVILQKDAEGNGYSPLAGADGDNLGYTPDDSTWSGEVQPILYTEELKKQGYEEEDCAQYSNTAACCVLYPVN